MDLDLASDNPKHNLKLKILFFSPHSAIWEHAYPEALVAHGLQKMGHSVTYVSCGGVLNGFCVPMGAHRLLPGADFKARNAICEKCTANDERIRSKFNLDGPRLSDLIGDEERDMVAQLLKDVIPQNFSKFKKENIDMGKISLYQYMLRNKQLDLDSLQDKWKEVLTELKNTLYSWQAAKKLFARYTPDRLIVYNGLYSVNRVTSKVAENLNIPSYFLHSGPNLSNRLQSLMIGKGDTFSYMPHLISQWKIFSNVPCSSKSLGMVTDHFEELARAKSVFVYSSPKSRKRFDINNFFGIDSSQKIVLATMSSYDEEIAAEIIGARKKVKNLLFSTQIEWIENLIEYFKARSEYFLIIRVHPREFPNNRDSATSQHAEQLLKALTNLPGNIVVNWPLDKIAIYDLIADVDLVLNSWSSVGKELAILGLPVLIYSKELVFYPSELNYLGESVDSYFKIMENVLVGSESIEMIFNRIRVVYRWTVFEFERTTAFIGDNFPEVSASRRTMLRKLQDRISRIFSVNYRENRDCKRMIVPMSSIKTISSMLERSKKSIIDLDSPINPVECSELLEKKALAVELCRIKKIFLTDSEDGENSKMGVRINKCINFLG